MSLAFGTERTATKALIDSGAPRTVFPRGTGDLLAVEFPDRPSQAPTKITILGHTWPAVTETVTLRLRPYDEPVWEAEVDFVLEEGLPFALLGYEGFMNQWAVTMDGYHGSFTVEPVDGFESRQPDSVRAQLREHWPDLTG